MEVEYITKTITNGVSKVLMDMFSRYAWCTGSSCVRQRAPIFSAEFRSFAIEWEFEHITASPNQMGK